MLPGLNDYLDSLQHSLYVCLPHSASLCLALPYSLSTAFPSFNFYRLTPKQCSQLSLSLSVVITLSTVVCSVQGVNQSSHRNQLPIAGTLQNDLLPGNIAPKIYLRKLVATVVAAFVVVVFAQFIRPQIVVQLQLQLYVTGCGREYPLCMPHDDISIRNPMKRMLYWPNGADEGQLVDAG